MAYESLNAELLKNIGGKENIKSITHCMTRLRFKLNDESKAKTEIIKNLSGVVTVVQSGGQYQVVIGNHVGEVCDEFVKLAGIQTNQETENDTDKPKGILNIFIDNELKSGKVVDVNSFDKKEIDWRIVSYKSLDNYFLKNISMEDFKKYMSEAYKIAGKAQRKTIIRLGLQMLKDSFINFFKTG